MTSNEIIKECRKLAKEQNLTFRRSKTIGLINGKACYEISSRTQYKTLHQAGLIAIWETLLAEGLKGQ